MNGVAIKPLTVGFHETQFLGKLNRENRLGFWFQLSHKERQKIGSPWGPRNPQALNRYSYVQNNPLRYTDPTGHVAYEMGEEDIDYYLEFFDNEMDRVHTFINGAAVAAGFAAGIACAPGLVALLACAAGAAAAVEGLHLVVNEESSKVRRFFQDVKRYADDDDRIVFEVQGDYVYATVYDESGNVKRRMRSEPIYSGAVKDGVRNAAFRSALEKSKRRAR